jgi:hypothetical protein
MTAETHWQRKVTPPASTDIIDVSSVEGDVDNRYTRDAAGKQEWGNGTDAIDISLQRNSAGVLGVTGGLAVSTTLAVTGASTLTGAATLTGGYSVPLTAAASTGTAISNFGVTTITSTAAATYGLTAPTAGVVKHIIQTSSSTETTTVNGGAGVTFDGTNDDLTFNAANEAVTLVGLSTVRWGVFSNVGSVGIS